MDLCTIGYEGRNLETFFSLLADNRVQTLVDVREAPISRKPGFSKSALAHRASAQDIHYIHIAALGCPRPIRHDYHNNKDWETYTHRFLSYLDTQGAAIDALAERVQRERCCLLCYEADYHVCHRLFVAERVVRVVGHGLRIIHLPNQGRVG